MKARKRVELEARKRFLLDKVSIANAPLGCFTITVKPYKLGDGSKPPGYGDPVTYRATVDGDVVSFTKL